MEWPVGLLVFTAGVMSGAVNAIAGGGTFLSFGAMTLAGIPPVSANATSSIAQFPGYVTSTLAYLKDVRAIWREAMVLTLISAMGACAGSLLLLNVSNPSFRLMVPWLLVAATLLFAVGPWLKRGSARSGDSTGKRNPLSMGLQFVTAIYGGFFGAGMGIMMLATLGIRGGDYHRLNALKNLLSIVIAFVAIAIFATGGLINWIFAAVLVPGVAIGGYSGVWLARRLPEPVVRSLVVGVGFLLATYYWVSAA